MPAKSSIDYDVTRTIELMRIDHIALYCMDLDGMREFFIHYFNGVPNVLYHNPKTGLKTYMLSFENSNTRLELMTRPEVEAVKDNIYCQASSTCPSRLDLKRRWIV